MRVTLDREFVIQAVIALAVCLIAWGMYIHPKTGQLRELNETIANRRSKASVLNAAAVERIAKQAPALRARGEEIWAKGQLAKDSSVLFGTVMALAEQHAVQVKNVRPGLERDVGKEAEVTVTRFDMTVEGEYHRIAEFLDGLASIDGYIRPTSVQLAPTKREGGQYAVMQLGFEVLRFALPKGLGKGIRHDDDDNGKTLKSKAGEKSDDGKKKKKKKDK